MDTTKRDKIIYRVIRFALGKILSSILMYSSDKYEPEPEPALIVSNHTTDFDPIFLAVSFPKHMYFVASEHVFRKGILSKLLIAAFHPISRVKGSTDATAALEIMRKLRNGHNVCLFAEGNRSFNGETGAVFPATGKLAKASHCSLVTFRITGGYLSTPRWSTKRRHGPIKGCVVKRYSSNTLSKLTPEGINELISKDLYENAYARNKIEKIPYKGKNLAEKLELALYLCPSCKSVGKLKSNGNHFCCDCGYSVYIDEFGFFSSDNKKAFTNVLEWDKWQEKSMQTIVTEASPDSLLFSDDNATVKEIDFSHNESIVSSGTASASPEHFKCGNLILTWNEITDMAVCGPARLVFSTANGRSLEMTGDNSFSVRKYLQVFQIINQKG